MTKVDLKTGMVAETRNGEKFLVMLNPDCMDREFINLDGNGWLKGSLFSNDLTRSNYSSDYDIVKVYTAGAAIHRLFSPNFPEELELLCERDEKPVEMTVSEIEAKLGIKNLKIVKE